MAASYRIRFCSASHLLLHSYGCGRVMADFFWDPHLRGSMSERHLVLPLLVALASVVLLWRRISQRRLPRGSSSIGSVFGAVPDVEMIGRPSGEGFADGASGRAPIHLFVIAPVAVALLGTFSGACT